MNVRLLAVILLSFQLSAQTQKLKTLTEFTLVGTSFIKYIIHYDLNGHETQSFTYRSKDVKKLDQSLDESKRHTLSPEGYILIDSVFDNMGILKDRHTHEYNDRGEVVKSYYHFEGSNRYSIQYKRQYDKAGNVILETELNENNKVGWERIYQYEGKKKISFLMKYAGVKREEYTYKYSDTLLTNIKHSIYNEENNTVRYVVSTNIKYTEKGLKEEEVDSIDGESGSRTTFLYNPDNTLKKSSVYAADGSTMVLKSFYHDYY